jgi:hypothetical protein
MKKTTVGTPKHTQQGGGYPLWGPFSFQKIHDSNMALLRQQPIPLAFYFEVLVVLYYCLILIVLQIRVALLLQAVNFL